MSVQPHSVSKVPQCGFYMLLTKEGKEPCLVKVYDYKGTRVVGFGVWDGGAFMPLSDVSPESQFIPVCITSSAVLQVQEFQPMSDGEFVVTSRVFKAEPLHRCTNTQE